MSVTLDLHKYTSLHDAMVALKSIIEQTEKEISLSSAHSNQSVSLNVITGQGIHSTNGIPVLKPAVEEYLRKHYYHYTPNGNGAFIVNVNKGVTEVEQEHQPLLSSIVEAVPPLATSFMMMHNNYFPTKNMQKSCNSSCYPAGRYAEGQTSYEGAWCFTQDKSIEQCVVPEHILNYWHRPLNEIYPPMNTMNCAFILSHYQHIKSLKDAYEWAKNPATDKNYHIRNEILLPPVYNTSILTLERVLYSAWKIFKTERNNLKKQVYTDIYEGVKKFPVDIFNTVETFLKRILKHHFNKKDLTTFVYANFLNFPFIKTTIDLFCTNYEVPQVCVQFQEEGFRLFLIDSIIRVLNNAFEGQEEVLLSKINEKTTIPVPAATVTESVVLTVTEPAVPTHTPSQEKRAKNKAGKSKKNILKGGGIKKQFRYIVIGDLHADFYVLLRLLEAAKIIKEVSSAGDIVIEVENHKDIRQYKILDKNTHIICLGDLVDGFRKNHTTTETKTVLENYPVNASSAVNEVKGFINEVEFSEMKILELLRTLEQLGLKVTIICGNHELMNFEKDFRYVSHMLRDRLVPCFSAKNSFVRATNQSTPRFYQGKLEKPDYFLSREEYFDKDKRGFELLKNKGMFNICYKLKTPHKSYFLMHGGIAKSLVNTLNMLKGNSAIAHPDTHNAVYLTCDAEFSDNHVICKEDIGVSDINIEFTKYLQKQSTTSKNPYITSLFEGENSIAWTRDQNHMKTCYKKLGDNCAHDYRYDGAKKHTDALRKIFRTSSDVATMCGHCIQNTSSVGHIPAEATFNPEFSSLELSTKTLYHYDPKTHPKTNEGNKKLLHLGANTVFFCEENKSGDCRTIHFNLDNASSGAFLKKKLYNCIREKKLNPELLIDFLVTLPSCIEITSDKTGNTETFVRSLQTQYPMFQFTKDEIKHLVNDLATLTKA